MTEVTMLIILASITAGAFIGILGFGIFLIYTVVSDFLERLS